MNKTWTHLKERYPNGQYTKWCSIVSLQKNISKSTMSYNYSHTEMDKMKKTGKGHMKKCPFVLTNGTSRTS